MGPGFLNQSQLNELLSTNRQLIQSFFINNQSTNTPTDTQTHTHTHTHMHTVRKEETRWILNEWCGPLIEKR